MLHQTDQARDGSTRQDYRPVQPEFAAPALLHWLESASVSALDAQPYGIVAMSSDYVVQHYNAAEAALSGLTASRVLGRHFFISVAPCTNNYLIAHRFENEAELDVVIDYVFALRMAPTPVRLRLLRSAAASRRYLLVQRRAPHVG